MKFIHWTNKPWIVFDEYEVSMKSATSTSRSWRALFLSSLVVWWALIAEEDLAVFISSKAGLSPLNTNLKIGDNDRII